MELYKTEKINPLGGCLPIVVQIPVFIALYWVLLGSVELRHAPFFGWIIDLSAPDTLFGTIPWLNMPVGLLPVLMAASMVLQMRLSPEPPDPVQARTDFVARQPMGRLAQAFASFRNSAGGQEHRGGARIALQSRNGDPGDGDIAGVDRESVTRQRDRRCQAGRQRQAAVLPGEVRQPRRQPATAAGPAGEQPGRVTARQAPAVGA